MKTIHTLLDNFNNTTEGLNSYGKALVALVVALIFFVSISALVGMVVSFKQ